MAKKKKTTKKPKLAAQPALRVVRAVNPDIQELMGELQCIDEGILMADGFDDALIGYVRIFSNTVALYDQEKCIQILVDEGATYEEALEYFEFNVVGAYVGEKTPGFATIRR